MHSDKSALKTGMREPGEQAWTRVASLDCLAQHEQEHDFAQPIDRHLPPAALPDGLSGKRRSDGSQYGLIVEIDSEARRHRTEQWICRSPKVNRDPQQEICRFRIRLAHIQNDLGDVSAAPDQGQDRPILGRINLHK